MNSRDAAYEENLQELLDATAAEAIPNADAPGKDRAESVAKTEEPLEEINEVGSGGRKKRKRTEDDKYAVYFLLYPLGWLHLMDGTLHSMPTKRKRSASVASDGHGSAAPGQDKTEATTPITTALLPPPAPTGKSRARRGGGRKNAVPRESPAMVDGEESTCITCNSDH